MVFETILLAILAHNLALKPQIFCNWFQKTVENKGVSMKPNVVSRKKEKNVEWFQLVSKKLSNIKITTCR